VLAAVGEDEVTVLDSREVELKGVPGAQCLHTVQWRA
jgi:hypothetical protein